MNVEIVFRWQPGSQQNHHVDRYYYRLFDVEWPGMPRPGDVVYIDIGRPDEEDWVVDALTWETGGPPHVILRPIVGEELPSEGYDDYLAKAGWSVR